MNMQELDQTSMPRDDRVVIWVLAVLVAIGMIGWRLVFGHINIYVVGVFGSLTAVLVLMAFVSGRRYRKAVLRARRVVERRPVPVVVYMGDGELTHQGRQYDLFEYVGEISMADTAAPISPL